MMAGNVRSSRSRSASRCRNESAVLSLEKLERKLEALAIAQEFWPDRIAFPGTCYQRPNISLRDDHICNTRARK